MIRVETPCGLKHLVCSPPTRWLSAPSCAHGFSLSPLPSLVIAGVLPVPAATTQGCALVWRRPALSLVVRARCACVSLGRPPGVKYPVAAAISRQWWCGHHGSLRHGTLDIPKRVRGVVASAGPGKTPQLFDNRRERGQAKAPEHHGVPATVRVGRRQIAATPARGLHPRPVVICNAREPTSAPGHLPFGSDRVLNGEGASTNTPQSGRQTRKRSRW